jgi:hypothetical protein
MCLIYIYLKKRAPIRYATNTKKPATIVVKEYTWGKSNHRPKERKSSWWFQRNSWRCSIIGAESPFVQKGLVVAGIPQKFLPATFGNSNNHHFSTLIVVGLLHRVTNSCISRMAMKRIMNESAKISTQNCLWQSVRGFAPKLRLGCRQQRKGLPPKRSSKKGKQA